MCAFKHDDSEFQCLNRMSHISKMLFMKIGIMRSLSHLVILVGPKITIQFAAIFALIFFSLSLSLHILCRFYFWCVLVFFSLQFYNANYYVLVLVVLFLHFSSQSSSIASLNWYSDQSCTIHSECNVYSSICVDLCGVRTWRINKSFLEIGIYDCILNVYIYSWQLAMRDK